MTTLPLANGATFRKLCRVIGGQDPPALADCIAAGLLHPLFDMAQSQDLLPALAVRCNEQNVDLGQLGQAKADALTQALMDNTLRNMQISAQALKIARLLNRAGITPLFLKGTAGLLTPGANNLGFRKQVDIDLIVPADDIVAAGEVFLTDGYSYCDAAGRPATLDNTLHAMKRSAAHHHLPPLVKTGYAATVELHRHFLERRFQRRVPLAELFSTARQFESHGASFRVPSTEYQIIHLVLGKFVTDGHLAARTFPLRDACDLIELLQDAPGSLDQELMVQRCGGVFALYCALVTELMGFSPQNTVTDSAKSSNYTRLMLKRFDSRTTRTVLDAYARADYLSRALVHSPAKLPAYLQRRFLSSDS